MASNSLRNGAAPPELGTFVSLDHVNLQVDDQRVATVFFLEGLGLTRDPYRMAGDWNMWVNIGAQQFHLPTGKPTPFPGVIGLVVPDLKDAKRRLTRIAKRLKGTQLECKEERGALAARDPWGRRFRLHDASSMPAMMPLALAYVEFWTAPKTTAHIARFYQEVVGAPAHANGGRAPSAVVNVGAHQSFRFVEKAGFTPEPHNNHVALYMTGYQAIYARMKKLKNVMEADQFQQFRFSRVLNLKTGKPVLDFEHEMRSLYHGDYGRPLVNRGIGTTRLGPAVGSDT